MGSEKEGSLKSRMALDLGAYGNHARLDNAKDMTVGYQSGRDKVIGPCPNDLIRNRAHARTFDMQKKDPENEVSSETGRGNKRCAGGFFARFWELMNSHLTR